ncbi:hypothetical protein SAMD00019534_014850, partial [Acytostelium subglobosum LB1]|uniref:hypothetical protein n=1 Tax=Acytostelium subglobosum LB1 TaxID=1410327 RepID=UPI000644AAF0
RMDEFENAVIITFDPAVVSPLKQRAVTYTETLRDSPDGWKFCLEKLFQTNNVYVKFFCLHVFQDVITTGQRYAQLTQDDRYRLRTTVVSYLSNVLASNPNEEKLIKNKYAQVVVLLFKKEYPEKWQSFFSEMLSMLPKGVNAIDIVLRILKSIDQEVVRVDVNRTQEELNHNTLIKDAMREGAINDIVKLWYEILVHYHQSNPQLSVMALQNIKLYISWIDIGLVVNDQFITLFYKLLNVVSQREEVSDCFKEIIYKGMDANIKLSLVQKLQIKNIVSHVSLDDLDFVIKMGALINLTGLEVLRSLESVKQLKNVKPLTEKHVQHITLLVQIIRNKMKYNKDFDFEKVDDGEDEQHFAEFRKDLAAQYRNLFRLCPEMVGSFVHNFLMSIIQDSTKFTFADIEVAIYLMYQMGEGISNLPEETVKTFEKFFGSMVLQVAKSNIMVSNKIHQCVSCIYFETVVRYAKCIPHDVANLTVVLSPFLDQRGVHNSNAHVRSRAGYLLNKLVKPLKVQLFPFISNIIESLKNHLVINYDTQQQVPFEEQLNFYESLGMLIGGSQLPPQDEQKYIEKLLSSPYQKMEEIISKSLYKSDTKEKPYYTNQLIQLTNVIGTFSKGFTAFTSAGPPKPEPLAHTIYFINSLKLIIQLPNLIPQNEEIVKRTFFYMHRMVDCLGGNLKPLLPEILPILLIHTYNTEKLIEFIMLLNQFIARYQSDVHALINDSLAAIITRIFKSMEQANPPEANTDEGRALLELQKTYYTFILTIMNNSLSSTLASPNNLSILERILSTVISGCKRSEAVSCC